jgi:ribosomal protein L37AE/L43A
VKRPEGYRFLRDRHTQVVAELHEQEGKEAKVKGTSLASRPGSLVCPLCEAGSLDSLGHDSARCHSCGSTMSGAMLGALREIAALPDTLGSHACECGHPEMRLLPDGTFHCPSCGSEVLCLEYGCQIGLAQEEGKEERRSRK